MFLDSKRNKDKKKVAIKHKKKLKSNKKKDK